jgi:hypothetical protein
MRTLAIVLTVALGCLGCRDKDTGTREAISGIRRTGHGERPSFYDTNNLAEYYGRCPTCQQWVKGYNSHLSLSDAKGNPIGGGFYVMGKCEHCKVELTAEKARLLTNDERIVRWMAP